MLTAKNKNKKTKQKYGKNGHRIPGFPKIYPYPFCLKMGIPYITKRRRKYTHFAPLLFSSLSVGNGQMKIKCILRFNNNFIVIKFVIIIIFNI